MLKAEPHNLTSFCLIGILLCLFMYIGTTSGQAEPQGGQTAPPNQSSPANTQDQKDQGIPDAPSTVQPAKPAPEEQPPASQPPSSGTADQPSSPPTVPPAQPSPDAGAPAANAAPRTPPPINVRTVPEGGATAEAPEAQEQLFTITSNVNQVLVPVTVKDDSGHLVEGLGPKNFSILENGKKQALNFFTSDPFALSAAVILDLGMKDVDLQKVNHTFPALEGAFSEFDEVSIYTYSNAVTQLADWGAVGQKLSATLDELRSVHGQNNGPPVSSGPLGPQGPMINNMPVDPGHPSIYAPTQEAHVLNDAILKAALDLSHRDRTRRKVIFIISDGREYRSNASYGDVLKVLLTNNILVYAVGVGTPALPGYKQLSKLHIPRFGYTDILPKYVNATTGGHVFDKLTRSEIEDAYSQALGDARNQYTMGYVTHSTPSGAYRDIEVLVDRPSCKSSIRPCVEVSARAGYYPAPPPQR